MQRRAGHFPAWLAISFLLSSTGVSGVIILPLSRPPRMIRSTKSKQAYAFGIYFGPELLLYRRFHFVGAEPVPGNTTYRFVSSYMCRQGFRTHRLHGCRFIETTWIITEQWVFPRSHNYHFKSRTKGQHPKIRDTRYQIQDTRYVPGTRHMHQMPCAWYVVHDYKVLL